MWRPSRALWPPSRAEGPRAPGTLAPRSRVSPRFPVGADLRLRAGDQWTYPAPAFHGQSEGWVTHAEEVAMNQSLRLGRIAGIPVGVNWSVLVILVLIADIVARNVLPARRGGPFHERVLGHRDTHRGALPGLAAGPRGRPRGHRTQEGPRSAFDHTVDAGRGGAARRGAADRPCGLRRRRGRAADEPGRGGGAVRRRGGRRRPQRAGHASSRRSPGPARPTRSWPSSTCFPAPRSTAGASCERWSGCGPATGRAATASPPAPARSWARRSRARASRS